VHDVMVMRWVILQPCVRDASVLCVASV
jgi:hypothetical protein